MIDEALMAQYVEMEEAEMAEKTQAELDAEAFTKKLAESKLLIEAEGGNAGLCTFCFGTSKLYIQRADGYEGIQYKVDNEIPSIQKCLHGKDITEDFPF